MALLTAVLPLPPMVSEALAAGLRKRGWTEGRDLLIEQRASLGDPTRALELAKELVSQRPELVLALNTAHALAVMRASAAVPVVTWCGYPVEAGLTTSLARPSGSVTGIANYASAEVWGKFVEILRELRPGLRELAILWDYVPPGFPDGPVPLEELRQTAMRIGINARVWTIHRERDLLDALSAIDGSPAEAMIVSTAGGIHSQPALSARIADLVTRRRLPAITDLTTGTFHNARCTFAYTPDVRGVVDRLAYFVDRILRGAKPGELPFEQPSRFNLVINLKVAEALGLKVPPALLARADQVIQ